MSETGTLAAFVAETTADDLPDPAVERATLAIRDFVGVAVYGAHHPAGETIVAYAMEEPSDAAVVLGRGTAGVEAAALANGAAGHAIDYDDTLASIPIHPTTVVFPAALAAADLAGGSTRDLLVGYVVGVEVVSRVGHSVFPAQYDRGFHSTGAVGPFGAAAAAASVLGLSEAEIRRAFGIAASSSSALRRNFGTTTKPLHAGHAAAAGVRAARLAERGATADERVLEGDDGYGAVMAGDGYDPTAITDGLGGAWATTDIAIKSYPSAHVTHGSMEALRRLVAREGLGPGDVESITATMADNGANVLVHDEPGTALEGKFSIQFCLAAVLVAGDAGVDEFADGFVRDDRVREQFPKVRPVYDSDALDGFGGYGGRVTVRTVSGDEYIAEERHAPGTPRNPLSADRHEEKFAACVDGVLDPEATSRLWTLLSTLQDGSLDEFETLVRAEEGPS